MSELTVPRTKTQMKAALVAERKSMRVKQKQSAFIKKTLSIYNGQKKRALEAGHELGYTIEQLRDLCREALEVGCFYCDGPVTIANMAVDHQHPLARGGSFSFGNLAVCDKSCNFQKGKLNKAEFDELLGLLHGWENEAATDVKRRLTIGGKWSFSR